MAPPSGLNKSSLPSDSDLPYTKTPATRAGSSSYLVPARLSGATDVDVNNPRRLHQQRDDRSRSRRRGKRAWKKLLWVKQSYPDNYTDQATFLENLQRNPRLQPYEFWPLVADSTVIVQHVCSVIIFVACFVGIFQERISPITVVSVSSFETFLGWCLYDRWVGLEAAEGAGDSDITDNHPNGRSSHQKQRSRSRGPRPTGVGFTSERPRLAVVGNNDQLGGSRRGSLLSISAHPQSTSASSLVSTASHASGNGPSAMAISLSPKHRPSSPLRGGRAQLRANALKSALLIYFTLLGLSPILKSLTRSTSSDSIWAMSFWLLAINIFFFDYSGTWTGVNHISVASLSTNAALMASTVLASRLPSTGQVFGLTIFSIEVFGLFPVFRRYARHRSWRFHVLLTFMLVAGAGVGVGLTLAGNGTNAGFPWRSGLLGMVAACFIAAIAMGGCSWWLLGLQKYKNEIHGPWDPARPVIISRTHWDDD
ncbi:hypothetical protein PspLS_01429 [Pyricularia sp. CBS 133598]|nr:hypothetical protein PspLS_01429 [Pyricularia sp. CBS 133598]